MDFVYGITEKSLKADLPQQIFSDYQVTLLKATN